MKATFLVDEQKEHLGKLGEILKHIETCNLLGEIDPAYYGSKKQDYIMQYASQMSRMAQTVFKKGTQHSNARLLGVMKAVG